MAAVTHRIADVTIVRVAGCVDEATAGDLGDALITGRGPGVLVVELTGLVVTSEVARRQLLLHLGSDRRRHATRLVHRCPSARRSLRALGFGFPVLPDLATACMGTAADGAPMPRDEPVLAGRIRAHH